MTGDARELSEGWELARHEDGPWLPAQVPGTVAAALGAGAPEDLDAHDWWFRVRFDAEAVAEGEQVLLELDGIATVAEVYLNGQRVLESESMFAQHAVDVGAALADSNELVICCRALAQRLAVSRRPRARWRTRLVSEGNLRFYRTMLLGRAPGFAPGPPVVGPWRPVRLVRRAGFWVEDLRVRARVEGDMGVLRVDARVGGSGGGERFAIVVGGAHETAFDLGADGRIHAELQIDGVERWWPHTHGTPRLYDVALSVDGEGVDLGRVGFRTLDWGPDPDDPQLRINDVPVFARGAVWTPLDLRGPHSAGPELRRALKRVTVAGMNMLRIPGTGCYESGEFHDLCDELGVLVWQDFMFANLDYPESEPGFMEAIADEARGVLRELGHRPSLAMLCGGSEVAQQVAMLGLDAGLAHGALFGELLPQLVDEADVDAPYVPSSPWGGDVPFRVNHGVAHYFGVGAYLRGLEDVRRSEIKFASECLAFSNVPDDDGLEPLAGPGGLGVHGERWKAGVPRDVGAGWDFEDVRDHYLHSLFGVDPVALRSFDQERYLELSRAVTGELMADVFGEWRSAASPCSGGLALWLRDLYPGAGWGVLDHRGEAKLVYHHLRRALAPVAVWSTDEGLNGIVAHVANDRPDPLRARLRVCLYKDLEVAVAEADTYLELSGHSATSHNIEELLGRFVDVSWSYRFGPPAQDLVVISMESTGTRAPVLLSQSFCLPAGRPTGRETADRLGLTASVQALDDERARLRVSSRRFAYGIRVLVAGYEPDDDGFSVEPGGHREIELRRIADDARLAGSVSALNLAGRVAVVAEGDELVSARGKNGTPVWLALDPDPVLAFLHEPDGRRRRPVRGDPVPAVRLGGTQLIQGDAQLGDRARVSGSPDRPDRISGIRRQRRVPARPWASAGVDRCDRRERPLAARTRGA